MWEKLIVSLCLYFVTVFSQCDYSTFKLPNFQVLIPNPAITCFSFSDFTEAFNFAQTFSLSTIRLSERVEASIPVVEHTINAELAIAGMGNTLRFEQTIMIENGGSMTVENVTLGLGKAQSGFEVSGFLRLINCFISMWQRKVVQVAGGFVIIENCTCENNREFIVAGRNCGGMVIKDSVFVMNRGIATFEDYEFGENSAISILNNTFQGNKIFPIFSLVLASNTTAASITFRNNSYQSCESLLISATLRHIFTSITSERYTNNSAGGITLSQKDGFTEISDCKWTGSSYPFIYIPSLQGEVAISNSEFTSQKVSAPIQIVNTGNATLCKVTVNFSLFHDYSISPEYRTAGAIYIFQCSTRMSNNEMRNVAAITNDMERAYGLCVMQSSYGEVWNLTVSEVAMSGSVIVFLEMSGFIDTVSVWNSTVGSNSILVTLGSTVLIRNVAFAHCASTAAYNIFSPIFIEMSIATVSNATLSDSPIGSGISVCYAEATGYNITMQRVVGKAVYFQLSSRMVIEHTVCRDCSINHYSDVLAGSLGDFRGVKIESSDVKMTAFLVSPGGRLEINGIKVVQTYMLELVSCEFASANVTDATFNSGQLQSVLGMILHSNVAIQTAYITQTIGGIASIASTSTILIAYCVFHNIESLGTAISLQASFLTIKQSEIRSAKCALFAEVFRQSSLQLVDFSMSQSYSSIGELIRARSAEISIIYSSFGNYYGTLLDCEECVVEISGCVVENGGFGEMRRAGTQARKGGFLHCVDCPSISLTNSHLFNISSDLGGALYCSAENTSKLAIFNSSFKECSASRGGAALVVNVSLAVENAEFIACSAELQGGALDLSIAEKHQKTVVNSRFMYNRAHEGGAVQWRGFPVEFTDVSFYNNSALYGPDTASYGVTFSAVIPAAIAPGQPIALSFELLDHYKQVVTTAELQLLRLLGSDGLNVSGITDRVIVEGATNFTNVSLLSSPGSNQTLLAQCRIENSDIFPNFINSSYPVAIRDCTVGEIKGTGNCTRCNPGYYSLSLTDSECNLCPIVATCSGGNDIQPKVGAWFVGDPQAPVEECFNGEKCLGTANNLCAEGYTGTLCSKCANGWFPLVAATCKPCPNAGVFAAEFTIVMVLIVVSLYGVLRFTVTSQNLVGLTCIKVVWTHAQFLAALAFIRTMYPPALQVLFRAMLDIVSLYTATFPFACIGLDYIHTAVAGVFSSALGLVLSVLLVLYRCARAKSLSPLRSELPTLLSFLLWVVPVSSLYSALQLFACVSIGTSTPLLVIDMTEKCWEGHHYRSVAIVSVLSILLHAIVPTVISAFSRKWVPYSLNDCNFRWTLLNFTVKVATLLSIIGQLPGPQFSQLFLAMLCLYFSVLANNNVHIYYELGCFVLVETSNLVLVTTYSLAFIHFHYHTEVSGVAITCAIYAVNASFLVFCWMYTRRYKGEYRPQKNLQGNFDRGLKDSSGVPLQIELP